MCLAIFKPAKVILPESSIREGWVHNPDGGGYAFLNSKGKIIKRKGITTLKEFGEAYAKDSKQYKKSPFIVHFRIRSAGAKSPDNTHPFDIADGALIHNGTISGTGATYTGDSDTKKFCDEFGDKLTSEWVKENKASLEDALTGGNKLVMLYQNGQHFIINEKQGVWADDVWYSNHSYKAYSSHFPSGASCSMGTC